MNKLLMVVIFLFSFLLVSCNPNKIDTSEYKKIGTLDDYAIYYTNIPECIEEIRVIDSSIWIEYGYSCSIAIDEDVYIAIKDNQQYDLLQLIEDGILEIEDIEDLIALNYFLPG